MKGTRFDILYTPRNRNPSFSDEFDNEFNVEYIESIASQELVLLHKPSKTVIEADLLFNLPATEQFLKSGTSPTSGVLFKLLTPVFSTKSPATWQKRLGWYVLSSKDRSGFAQSLRRIDSWEFDRIIPCHGDVIERDSKQLFRVVFEWFLEGPKSRILAF